MTKTSSKRGGGSGSLLDTSIPGIIPFDKLSSLPGNNSDSKFEPISGIISDSKIESKINSSSKGSRQSSSMESVFKKIESVSVHSQKSGHNSESKKSSGKKEHCKIESMQKSKGSQLEAGVIPGIIPYDKLDAIVPKELQEKNAAKPITVHV